MQDQSNNPQPQRMPTFFINNAPQSVGNIQTPQQIYLGTGNTAGNNHTGFMQSVRMPISTVNQWPTGGMPGSRIMLSQSATNDQFIMPGRPEITANQPTATLGVNQRFIHTPSFVVHPIQPAQLKQFQPSHQLQLPISTNQINLAPAATMPTQSINTSGVIATSSATLNTTPSIQQSIQINNSNNNVGMNLQNNIHKVVTSQLQNVNATGAVQSQNKTEPTIQSHFTSDNNTVNNSSAFGNDKTDSKLSTNTNNIFANSCINNKRVIEMVQSIDPLLQVDEDLQEMLNQFLENFVLSMTEKAKDMTKLRNSSVMEVKDFQYLFERDWDVFVPGYNSGPWENHYSGNRQRKGAFELEIHKLRCALIQKHFKKS